MAYASDPTQYPMGTPNPADVGTPSTYDPNAGYVYQPSYDDYSGSGFGGGNPGGLSIPSSNAWTPGPTDVNSGGYPGFAAVPAAPAVGGSNSGLGGIQSGSTDRTSGGYPGGYPAGNPAYGGFGGGGGGAPGGIPWDKIFDTSLGNRALDQQQQYLDFMLKSYLPTYMQNQAAVQQLQAQIQQAAMTGDWNGVQTLQSKLQQAQIALQNSQANMQNITAGAQLSGVYGNNPTLQAQQMENQFTALGGNQALTARGQDVQAMGIEAQLAQSPLVAWYTARGLPPPQSALLQAPKAYTPPSYSWNLPSSAPAVPQLPIDTATPTLPAKTGYFGPTQPTPTAPNLTFAP